MEWWSTTNKIGGEVTVEQWRSINEIAKELNIPESTVRRYFNTFKEFLTGQNFGRIIKYPEQALTVVEKIYKQYQQGKSTEEIREDLKAEFRQVIEVKAEPIGHTQEETSLVISQRDFAELIHKNNDLIKQNADSLKIISEILTRVLDQEEVINELRNEIAELREQQKKPGFLDRVFGRKK